MIVCKYIHVCTVYTHEKSCGDIRCIGNSMVGYPGTVSMYIYIPSHADYMHPGMFVVPWLIA